ncbi:MAG: porin [Gammaproteobacteria bacterium]|nr:porin [Gammaproteobacteria bacterium]
MKKLLTLAVAAAFAAPLAASANPTVYGRVNVNLVHQDMDTEYDGRSEDAWNVENNASRVGVKGSEDLGNGLSAIYQFEFGVDASDTGGLSGRLAYAGITGGFGTFAMGRQWTPYYGSVDKTDIMQIGTMNDHYLGLTRVGNAVAYVTPNFNGLSGKVALVIDNGGAEDTGEDFADWTNVSVDYDNGPLSIGASWLRENSGEDDLWGLAGKYNFGMFALIGQYESAEDDLTSWALGGEVYLGNNTLRAVYGHVDDDGDDGSNWAIGAEHNFSKRTRVFAEYEDSEYNSLTHGDHSHYVDGQRFGVGIRHDF